MCEINYLLLFHYRYYLGMLIFLCVSLTAHFDVYRNTKPLTAHFEHFLTAHFDATNFSKFVVFVVVVVVVVVVVGTTISMVNIRLTSSRLPSRIKWIRSSVDAIVLLIRLWIVVGLESGGVLYFHVYYLLFVRDRTVGAYHIRYHAEGTR